MKKNNKKGFTLVELVIVVAVMAVLVAVAIPTVSSIVGSAKSAVDESNARTIESVIKLEEAEKSNAGAGIKAADVAQAVYEAKLGLKTETKNDEEVVPTFYYSPSAGTVVAHSEEDDFAAPDDAWTITFENYIAKAGGTVDGVKVVSTKVVSGAYATDETKCWPEAAS